MTAPRKILTIFGTRPEAIKLFPLIHRLAKDARFVSRTCVTAQHREMLDQVLAMAEITPDHDLDLMRGGQALDALMASLLVEIGKVLDIEQPDFVVVQGDTATALAGGMAAFYRKIPVVHVEAGLRSDDIQHPWPEEVNRRMIAIFATIHCAPTQSAVDALLAENVAPDAIHLTGNTVIDALHWVSAKIAQTPPDAGALSDLKRKFAGKRIIGVTCHRRENLGEGMAQIAQAIRQLSARQDVAIILPMHRNPDIRAIMQSALGDLDNVALTEPLDYLEFVQLLGLCALMLTDSGGVQEEAPALGKPVLVMRETTERPEGVAAGTARLVGTDPDRIVSEVERLLDDDAAYAAMAQAHNPFGDGKAAKRICELLAQA